MSDKKKATGQKGPRLGEEGHLGWVPLAQMRVRPEGQGQRLYRPHHAREIAAEFDPKKFGTPTVNAVDGFYWVVNGVHRIEAYKMHLGEGRWEDQLVQCRVHENLTIPEEADLFDGLNHAKNVDAFAKFMNRATAGRSEENAVYALIQLKGLRIARKPADGTLCCASTLLRVHRRGEGVLARTLDLDVKAYGNAGLEAPIIDGLGLFCARYNGGELRDDVAIKRLSETRGNVAGLLGKAAILRKQTGAALPHCVAAAAVEIINKGGKGKKLTSWWKAGAR